MPCAFQVSRQHLDAKGIPLEGGYIYCFSNGTTEFHNTFRDSSLTELNPNPIVLDSRGSCSIYWDGTPVRFELWYNNELVDSWDNITEESSAEFRQHLQDFDNPHNVTAAQVGTYDAETIDRKISEASAVAGRFIGVVTPYTLNIMIASGETSLNDFADMSSPGTIVWDGGELDVEQYDSVIQTTAGWVKRAKQRWGIDVNGECFNIIAY